MPAVNYELMYQEMVRKLKGGFNQILYWSHLLDSKNQTLTPNPDVIYLMPFINTKDTGPMVLEIPAAGDDGLFNGSVMDYWQAAIEDIGPGGVDKGKGGKYLILPDTTTGDFFNTLAALLKDNPPAHADAPMVAKLKCLGIVAGRNFDIDKADATVRTALQGVPKAALEKITSHFKRPENILMAESSRRRRANTERTILNGPPSLTSDWERTGHKTSIPRPKRMRMVSPTAELTSTSFISRRGRCRPSGASGPSRCTTPSTSSSQTTSTVMTSASATL